MMLSAKPDDLISVITDDILPAITDYLNQEEHLIVMITGPPDMRGPTPPDMMRGPPPPDMMRGPPPPDMMRCKRRVTVKTRLL